MILTLKCCIECELNIIICGNLPRYMYVFKHFYLYLNSFQTVAHKLSMVVFSDGLTPYLYTLFRLSGKSGKRLLKFSTWCVCCSVQMPSPVKWNSDSMRYKMSVKISLLFKACISGTGSCNSSKASVTCSSNNFSSIRAGLAGQECL